MRDKKTNEPIQGAKVKAYGDRMLSNFYDVLDSDTTDLNGHYSITVPGIGDRWIVVTAKNYHRFVGHSELQVFVGTFPQELNIYLTKTKSKTIEKTVPSLDSTTRQLLSKFLK
ncbi:MAG: hypothetical protein U9O49_01280 [Candidatus Thermoplasmatota archaeon]|nr:hypothetical protein [Candidatus Thermoplasmatota archaeon]